MHLLPVFVTATKMHVLLVFLSAKECIIVSLVFTTAKECIYYLCMLLPKTSFLTCVRFFQRMHSLVIFVTAKECKQQK